MTKFYPEVLRIEHNTSTHFGYSNYVESEDDGVAYVRSDKVPVPSFSGWLVAMLLWLVLAVLALADKDYLLAALDFALAVAALHSVITTRNEKRELHDLLFPDES